MTPPCTPKVSHIATASCMRARAEMASRRFRKVRLETGEVVQHVDLGSEFFGEGITIIKDKVFPTHFESGVGLVYDLKSFHFLRRFAYSGEGWGSQQMTTLLERRNA